MSDSVKKNPTRVAICCRKGDPFQGPKLGSCLTLGDEFFKETCADRARDFRLLKASDTMLNHDFIILIQLLQEGGPLPGPKTGLLSNNQK